MAADCVISAIDPLATASVKMPHRLVREMASSAFAGNQRAVEVKRLPSFMECPWRPHHSRISPKSSSNDVALGVPSKKASSKFREINATPARQSWKGLDFR